MELTLLEDPRHNILNLVSMPTPQILNHFTCIECRDCCYCRKIIAASKLLSLLKYMNCFAGTFNSYSLSVYNLSLLQRPYIIMANCTVLRLLTETKSDFLFKQLK